MLARAVLTREFPGSVDATRFVERTSELLGPHGFEQDNTIACVGLCRDELARPLIDDVADMWGEAFNFSSLGGQLTLGRTGFAAARSHAPQHADRERFVFFSLPHIGIDRNGILGQLHRRGQREPTATCGALSVLAGELNEGFGPTELDPGDLELSLLRHRLGPLVPHGSGRPDIAELTRIAGREFLKDLERLIDGGNMAGVDYAVFSGIQIHTTDGDQVWPTGCYAMVAGARVDLSF